MKRYNLAVPHELWGELKVIARKRGTSVVEVIRSYLKLGLLAERGELEIRTKDGREVEVI